VVVWVDAENRQLRFILLVGFVPQPHATEDHITQIFERYFVRCVQGNGLF